MEIGGRDQSGTVFGPKGKCSDESASPKLTFSSRTMTPQTLQTDVLMADERGLPFVGSKVTIMILPPSRKVEGSSIAASDVLASKAWNWMAISLGC